MNAAIIALLNSITMLPLQVRLDKRLTANAKLLYSDLVFLCGDKDSCKVKSAELKELYGVSQAAILAWLNQLEKYGYIKRDFGALDNKDLIGAIKIMPLEKI